MAKIFESGGLGTAAAFVRPRTSVADSGRSIRSRGISRDICFPTPTAAATDRCVRRWSTQMVARFADGVHAGHACRSRGRRGLTIRQAGDARVDRGEGNARARRARHRRGRLCEPAAARHGAAVRSRRSSTRCSGPGKYTGNLRRDDLDFDSPYNTYRYPGLPPGPIASPGKRLARGRRRARGSDYLYFVSRNDGSHEFARTLTEHNRNVQRWQVQYFRDPGGREGGGQCRNVRMPNARRSLHRRYCICIAYRLRPISASFAAPRSSCAWTDGSAEACARRGRY